MKQNSEAEQYINIIKSGKLTFYIAPHRIGLESNLQFFSIQAADQYCKKNLSKMRALIVEGHIQSLSDFYDNSNCKVVLKYSQLSWFYDAVERLDPKPLPEPFKTMAAVKAPKEALPAGILLEPDSTDPGLLTALMVVEV